MSYTELDWLRDTARDDRPFDNAARDDLLVWMREDQRVIVRAVEHAALVCHMLRRPHDHDLCEMAAIHWAKDARDWEAA